MERLDLVATDLMHGPPLSVPATATVREALAALHDLDARHLPVVNAARELVGMVSDRDLRGPLPAHEARPLDPFLDARCRAS